MKSILPHRLEGETIRRLVGIGLFLVLYAALTAGMHRELKRKPEEASLAPAAVANEAPTRKVALRDGLFYVDGAPLFIKAVGWDPARPGELPWTRHFDTAIVDSDFARMAQAGFNTIRSWAPLRPEELALAAKHHLHVLQGIWVPPDGDFADPRFHRQVLREVARAVEASRSSPAIIGYLVLNEPRAQAVAHAGLENTAALLREIAATVRALDPQAPVGYASWPGLEALDDELLDFVAFNIYPHRPHVVMDELGLLAYVRLIRRTVARTRPLLISEFGLSVSPGRPLRTPGRGGASLEAQAKGLVDLAGLFTAAGAAGTAVFQWNDGWWKNNESAGDERSHDPYDPEEWFGLVEFPDAADRLGRPRPALAAFSTYQRVIFVEPRDGQVDPAAIPVRLFAPEPVQLQVRVKGGGERQVALKDEGNGWHTGTLSLADAQSVRYDVELTATTRDGKVIRSERRLLRAAPPRTLELALAPRRIRAQPDGALFVDIQAAGEGAAGLSVTVAAFTEDQFNEQRVQVRLDRHGHARVRLRAPGEETLLTLLAFEDAPSVPPAERASAWAVAEIRRTP
jgi:hypothetical protein